MGLKPRAARWFEVLVARSELTRAAEPLAKSSAIEVECPPGAPSPLSTNRDSHSALERFDELARRHGPHWPEPTFAAASGSPAELLDKAMARIETWTADAEPVLVEAEELERELERNTAPGTGFTHSEVGLIVAYLSVLGALFVPALLWLALGGALLHAVGAGLEAPRRLVRASLAALGALVERIVQLGINTVSFARVGAFALAHAGLSVAMATLSNATHRLWLAVTIGIIGNALVMVLEGLVVGIQTTRLILFEFFVRFLKCEGCMFRPLLPPRMRLSASGGSQ